MESRGVITGITRGTNRKHIVRAALESIAFQVNDLLECLKKDLNTTLTELKVDGGATQNDFLMQFQSNISNINILKPNNVELTALGAALLSGIGSGYWENIKLISEKQKVNKTYYVEINDSKRENILKKWSDSIKKCIS